MRSLSGRLAARMGRREEALKYVEELEQDRIATKSVVRSPSLRGKYYYEQARIYAAMGEKAKAVERLRAAIGEGRLFRQGSFYFDFELVPLLGDYEPFQQLLEPKG